MGNKPNSGAGRPPAQFDRQVADALIDATVRLLEEKPRSEITVREIALAAGVNKAMIGYYFNNKNRLFEVLLEHFMTELLHAFLEVEKQIENVNLGEINPTRLLVSSIARIYAKHASGLRLQIMEIAFNSELKRYYIERLTSRPVTVLQRIIQRLIDLGVYRNDLDPLYTAMTFEWLLSYNAMTSHVLQPVFALNLESSGPDNWCSYVTDLLDRGCRPRGPVFSLYFNSLA
jgi:AcrR family transcriptional regulator